MGDLTGSEFVSTSVCQWLLFHDGTVKGCFVHALDSMEIGGN